MHIANQTDIPLSIEVKKVILVDHVLHTGRTIRAAPDALQDFGRPQKVELCVLIDRKSGRELPTQPDYFGKEIESIIFIYCRERVRKIFCQRSNSYPDHSPKLQVL